MGAIMHDSDKVSCPAKAAISRGCEKVGNLKKLCRSGRGQQWNQPLTATVTGTEVAVAGDGQS